MIQESDRVGYLKDGLQIHRILNGMWQVSGAHGPIDRKAAIKNMRDYAEHGFVTWDLADHYGPAEDFVKDFRESLIKEGKQELLSKMKFFTKWVPRPQKITRDVVKKAIDLSRRRMGMEVLDMVQFHWWDYDNKEYLNAMQYLDELREKDIIKHLGVTNFDTKRMQEFVDLGINVISNQVQYSLIDRRPERKMAQLCKKNDIKLLVYGTLGGGLLTERFLNKPSPSRYELQTASLQKYRNMVYRWGDWELFQKLLTTLREIAKKHEVSIANVAVRYVLQKEFVGGAIIGARLGISDHITENARVFNFSLENKDLQEIEAILIDSNDLLKIIGDCGDEYR